MDLQKVLNGSNGTVWLDGDALAELKKIDVKAEGEFEDTTVCGDYRAYPNFLGYTVTGSMTLAKVDSKVLNKYRNSYRTGNIPAMTIISKLTDSTGKSERVAIKGVVPTTLSLINMEAKKLIDEEIPIKATDYEILEVIA